jgi:hypothetical protein
MPAKGTSGLMSGEGKRVGMQSGVGSAPFLDSTKLGKTAAKQRQPLKLSEE